mmetsp:Transcript_79215/g.240317  ORF Transcript_79215/g.240317 Transcript_79215/m.240317 type:complete len:182 (-) Transcript_79215:78-623(-)
MKGGCRSKVGGGGGGGGGGGDGGAEGGGGCGVGEGAVAARATVRATGRRASGGGKGLEGPSSHMTPNEYGGSESCTCPSATIQRYGSWVWLEAELGWPSAHFTSVIAEPSSHSQRLCALLHEPPIQMVFSGHVLDISWSAMAACKAACSCCCWASVLGMASRMWAPHAWRASLGPAKPKNS